MKSLIHTIPVFIVINLMTGGLTLSQNPLETYTISGSVNMPGVEMQGLPNNPVTDARGYYACTVSHGWSGTVKPQKEGYTFAPVSRVYTRVMDNQYSEDYRPIQIGPVAMIDHAGGRRALVVPADDIKAEELSDIVEDMQIMSHILDGRFKQKRQVQGLFTDFGDFFERDDRTTEAIYLQGYGILFSMEVNFTFIPPAEPETQQPEDTTENVDPTWQQARRQVFQPGASQRLGASESTEEQSHKMVEELKRDLIETLKHAANIRVLQPDERIILTIIGNSRGVGGMMGSAGSMMGGMGMMGGMSMSGGFGGGISSRGRSRTSGMGGMGEMRGIGGGMTGGGMMGGSMGMGGMAMGGMGTSSATVLTIRTKKSDVDAFAKGELNIEQFQEKVKTVMY
ncbi:MAG: hypothetical protein JXM79_14570 [Sedimentisphaerales bacterium]|nr:hypothetical protein [Sedimentisphaerales bacterium]